MSRTITVTTIRECGAVSAKSFIGMLRVLTLVLFATTWASMAAADTPAQRYGVVAGWDSNVAAKFSDLGIGLLRTPCDWNEMQPTSGAPTWGCSQTRIDGATGAGKQVLLTAGCTPSWARSGGDCNTLPTNMTTWYNFVRDFVLRYQSQNVILGIYNEPDIDTGGAAMTAANYCTLATTAMQARDSVNTSFRLALPETSNHAYGNGWFASAMSCIRTNATLRPQDVITVHWYDGPAMSTYLDYVRTQSGGNNNVWLSETGAPASNQTTQQLFYNARLSEFNSLTLTRPWWKKIIFYALYDPAGSTEGIVDANNTPRLAYYTLQGYVIGTTIPSMVGGQHLTVNTYVTSSGGSQYHLYYQDDGNLVLYDSGWTTVLWNTATNGTVPNEAAMQGDGNFVVYDDTQDRWSSGTGGNPGAYLIVSDIGGTVRIFAADGTPLRVYP